MNSANNTQNRARLAEIAPMLTESGNRCGLCGARGTLIAKLDIHGEVNLTCQRCHGQYEFEAKVWVSHEGGQPLRNIREVSVKSISPLNPVIPVKGFKHAPETEKT